MYVSACRWSTSPFWNTTIPDGGPPIGGESHSFYNFTMQFLMLVAVSLHLNVAMLLSVDSYIDV
jgi:hypothetical protein